jgi:predicted transcriptional regulator
MPRMKVGSQYYTAKEVKEKLDITQGELNTFIRNGTLKPETPPGKKQGVYKRADVDQLVRERQAFMTMPQKTSSTFSKATKEDIKATVEITRVLFGLRESSEAAEARRLSWFDKNQELFYVLKSEEQVVGYALMIPLKLEKIEKILNGEEYSQEVKTEEIEDFVAGKPLHILLNGSRCYSWSKPLRKAFLRRSTNRRNDESDYRLR